MQRLGPPDNGASGGNPSVPQRSRLSNRRSLGNRCSTRIARRERAGEKDRVRPRSDVSNGSTTQA
jgi:hypothetical protein